MKRLLTVSATTSAVLLGVAVILWPVSYWLNLSRGISQNPLTPSDSISIFSGYRLGVERGGVWFYNYQMPYRGSIISSLAHVTGLDFPGIYFRHISQPSYSPAYTTLRVSLSYPMLIFTALPTLWIIRRRHLWFGRHKHAA